MAILIILWVFRAKWHPEYFVFPLLIACVLMCVVTRLTLTLNILYSVCFVWIWEQTAIISLYSINWLVCITETECVYCAVRNGSLYIILRSAHTVYLCVLCGSENKQRLFPYTALTDWFITDGVCLLSGTDSISVIQVLNVIFKWSWKIFLIKLFTKSTTKHEWS